MTRKHKIAFATGLLLSFLTWAPAQADFQAGLDAYNRGAYEEAVPHLRRAAEAGDPEAQYYLGLIYGDGDAVARDLPEAAFWLDCAAAAEGGISMRARRLQARLRKSLPEGDQATNCPTTTRHDSGAWSFDLFASPELANHRAPAATGGFAKVMGGLRDHTIVSLFFLPGEAVVVAGREGASLVGAKQVAYGIDAVRNPGNDLLYMLVAMLSWVGLYKLLMAMHGLLHRISDFSVPLDSGERVRKRRKQRPHHGHAS